LAPFWALTPATFAFDSRDSPDSTLGRDSLPFLSRELERSSNFLRYCVNIANVSEITVMTIKLVGLIRVSTDKQERSGLGQEAQEALVEKYRCDVGGRLLKTFMEVESGTHDDVDSRPELKAAVAHAKRNKATLVIAKLDRLVRSTIVAAYLKGSGIKFVACDNPHANELTIDILAAVAADEARRIKDRTKAALRAYRDNGHVSKRIKEMYGGEANVPLEVRETTAGKLGSHLPQCYGHLTPETREKGWRKSAAKRRAAAIQLYEDKAPMLLELWENGFTLRGVADHLNREEMPDDDGETEDPAPKPFWSAMKVKRVLDRVYPDRTRPAS
jgi:DNA invertase Pin-like site-specific DNA recombinase